MQTGLECIGDIDIYDIYEVISLAAENLSSFTDNFCIEDVHRELASRHIIDHKVKQEKMTK